MFFTEKNRKKNLTFLFLALFLFSGVVFVFSDVYSAHAAEKHILSCKVGAGFTDCIKAGGATSDNIIVTGFKWLLYGIFVMFGWIASLAITIFEWAIDPKDVTMLFNDPGVYESWKFIRDFFNLFFILVLLYVAFKIVFQIEHDFKKTLLSIVLAALFINFSFPVTRVLIDVTNVPMYFFANQMAARDTKTGTGVFGATMTASHIKGILIPGAQDGGSVDTETTDISRILMAVVFIFLFSVTLLVLAVMFVIRLVALVVLVIFSPVGFAASIVPGLEQYSKMWWENFWKYAFFGPAAMLMLLIATRFFASIGDATGPLMASMTTVAGSNTIGADRTFFASMALFTIPIIMLWIAMGLAQKFSIAGAATVVGKGQAFSKWAGKAPFRAGWVGAEWIGRKYEKKVVGMGNAGKYFSPTAIKDAWKGWREEAVKSDKDPVERASGTIQDRLNKTFGDHTNHAFEVKQHQGNARAKELLDVSQSSAYLIDELNAAYKSGKAVDIEGATIALLKTNNFNDLMEASQGKGYGENLDRISAADSADGKEHVRINSVNAGKILDNLLSRAGFKDGTDEMALEGTALSEVALVAGNGTLFGRYNFKDGHFHKNSEGDQAKAVAGKFRNLESQDRQKKSHPDNAYDYYYDGEGVRHIIDLNGEVGVQFMGTYTEGDTSEARRSRDDFKTGQPELYDMMNSSKVPPNLKKALEAKNKDILKTYIETVTTMVRGKGASTEPKKTKVENSRKLPASTMPTPDWGTTPGASGGV